VRRSPTGPENPRSHPSPALLRPSASDDLPDANRIRNLVADIEDVRRAKVRLCTRSSVRNTALQVPIHDTCVLRHAGDPPRRCSVDYTLWTNQQLLSR